MKRLKRSTAFLLCFCMVWNLSVPEAFALSGKDSRQSTGGSAYSVATGSNAENEAEDDAGSDETGNGDAMTGENESNNTGSNETENGNTGNREDGSDNTGSDDDTGKPATPTDAVRGPETATMANALKLYNGYYEISIINDNDGHDLPIKAGDTCQLETEITPADDAEFQPVFESDNPSVAEVDADSGLITAVSTGGANITVSIKYENGYGNQSSVDSVYVRVIDEEPAAIALYANGGIFDDGTEKKELLTKAGEYFRFPNVENGDKVLRGWYSDSECTQLIEEDYYMYPVESMDLYAGWVDTCTVTFDYGGYSDGWHESTEYKVGQGMKIGNYPSMPDGPVEAMDGKMFAGWLTPDGTLYQSYSIRDYRPSGNETIIAQWSDYYTVTYDYNGVRYQDKDSSFEYVLPGNKLNNRPYLPEGPSAETNDKMFAGWKNSESKLYSNSDLWNYIPQRSETLTAQWVDYYEITFDYNGVEYNGNTSQITKVMKGENVSAPYIPSDPGQTGGKILTGWKIPTGEVLTGSQIGGYRPMGNDTIVAQWAEYNVITFDYNGVTYNGKKEQTYHVAQGQALESNYAYMPNNPDSTEGKMFTGWKNESGNVITSNDIRNYVPTGSETLTAQWLEEYYTITFDYNGVTYDGADSYKGYAIPGKALTLYPYISSDTSQTEGKILLGWEINGKLIVQNDLYKYVPLGNETLTAKWTEESIPVTFDYNGIIYSGKDSTTINVAQNQAIGYNVPSFSSDPANTKGMLLEGWEFGGKLYTRDEVVKLVPKEAMTFTAKWTSVYYTVMLDYNGIKYNGKLFEEKSVLPGEALNTTPSLPTEPYQAYNQVLLGWQTAGGELISNDQISSYVPSGDETLTARWSKYVTVTYDLNGGKMNGSNKEYVPEGETVQKAYAPSKAGYLFAGWYEKDTGRKAVNGSYKPNGNVVLVAEWREFYTVTYDANGGIYDYDSYKKEEVIRGESVSLKQGYGYSREGFTLEGWCEDPECRGEVLTGNYIPEKDITLYAKWASYYTITLELGIGTINSRTLQVIQGEAIGTLTKPYSSEAAFEGWYLDEALTRAVSRSYIPDRDITLYAKWNQDTYDVTFHAGGAWIYDSAAGKYRSEITWKAVKNLPLSTTYINTSRSGYDCVWYLDQDYKTPFNWSAVIDADLDLYAGWTKQVTVFWDAEGGRDTSGKMSGSFTVKPGGNYSLPRVERDGYALSKWVTDTGAEVTDQTGFYENTYLKAVWEEGYRVTLELQGGVLYYNDYYKPVFYVKKGEKCSYRPTPTKLGNTCLGWFDEIGNDIGRISSYIPGRDTILTARWSGDYITIRFHLGESEIYDDSTGEYVQLLEYRLPKNKSYYEATGSILSNPKLAGKAFTGWTLTEGGTEYIDLLTYQFTKDTDLYPVWKDCWYIGVELMGGSVNGNTDNHTQGYKVAKGEELTQSSLKPENMVRPGYIFDGWYDNADYAGEKYTVPFTPAGSMTLYAKWLEGDAKKYTVSFDTVGGTAVDSLKVAEGSRASKPEDPEKEGCIFDGWYRDSEYKYLYHFTEVVYQDVNLYAKWIETTDVKDATILIVGEYVYTGELIIPELTVKMGSRTLQEEKDYMVSGGGVNAGNVTVTVTGAGGYTGSHEVSFVIRKAETEAEVPAGPFEFTYGQKFKEVTLPAGWAWKNPDSSVGNAGSRQAGIVFAAADLNHEDKTALVDITVKPLSISGAVILLDSSKKIEYDGKAKEPAVLSVTLNDVKLPAGAYDVAYSDNTEPGTAKVTVTGKGNYEGVETADFIIEKGDPETIIGQQVYEAVYGSTLRNIELPEGWTWQNPDTSVGGVSTENKTFPANYKAPADSKYKDKENVKLKVHVTAIVIKFGEVSLEEPPYLFTGNPVEPAVTVICGGVTLEEKQDYTVSYENNDKVGLAKAVVTGKGNYGGTVTKEFKIITDPYDISSADITLTPDPAMYTGKEIEPETTVVISLTPLTRDKDYTVEYGNNVEPGQAEAVITGKGDYHGSQTVHFFINPAEYKLTAVYGSRLRDCTLPNGWEWKNPEDYVGDVIEGINIGNAFPAVYTSGGITKTESFYITVTPKDIEDETVHTVIDKENLVYDKTEKRPKITIKDNALGTILKEDEDYTVTYSDNKDAGVAGVKIEGIHNYYNTILDNFTIEQADPKPETGSDKIEDHKIHLTIREKPFFLYASYSGDGEITFTSSDESIFTVEKRTNEFDEPDGFLTVKKMGQAQLTIEVPETKNYKGAKLIYNVEVVPVRLADSDIKLEKTSYTYTGEQIKPGFTVVSDGTTLIEETDYTVSYGPNIKAGADAGSVTVTGSGDYEGTASASFTIEKAENPAAVPGEVSAVYGQRLEEISLTGGWEWRNPQEYVGNTGTNSHEVVLAETDNYLEKAGTTAVEVTEKTLTDAMVTLEYEETEYDGTPREPKVTVEDNGLITEADYTVKYLENTGLGTAVVEITAKGNYTGTVEKHFTIIPAVLKAGDAVVDETFVYDGTAKEPEPLVKAGGKTLVRGTDYEVAYKENINAGTGQAEVTGKGNYQGTVTAPFTIEKAETVVATPSELKAVYGNQLKDVTLPENFSWTDGESYVGKTGVNQFTAVYTSPDPNYKDVEVTLMVSVGKRMLKAEDFMLDKLSYVYDKTAKEPGVTALAEYITIEDYTVSYEMNQNAGTAYAMITGGGNCQGWVRIPYIIEKASPVITVGAGTTITRYVSAGPFNLEASVSNRGTLVYTSSDGSVATVEEDGTVKPVRAGTVTITASYEGDGNYRAVKAEVAVVLKHSGSSGGSSSGGSSGGSSAGKGNSAYSEVPQGYTGPTKTIGNVTVPEYVEEGVWEQAAEGKWRFTDKSGRTYAGSWVPAYNPHADMTKGQSAFNWFVFDKDGNMITGWYTDENGNTFYLNPVSDNTLGSMATGWRLIDGKYYYFNNVSDGTRGKLLKDTVTPDGYYVGKDGVWDGNARK